MDDVPYYCLYKTAKCRNLRGVKRDGTLHRMCNEHRAKANESQRKSEAKKRFRKFATKRHFHHRRQSDEAQWGTPHETLVEACDRLDQHPTSPWSVAEATRASLTTQDEDDEDEQIQMVPKMALGFILDN